MAKMLNVRFPVGTLRESQWRKAMFRSKQPRSYGTSENGLRHSQQMAQSIVHILGLWAWMSLMREWDVPKVVRDEQAS